MRHRFLSLTGFVLAGGASRRMGRPKAALVLGHETMLVRQVRLLTAVSRAVVVVGPSASSERLGTVIRSLAPTDVSVIPDQLPGRGPLGGIYTGLLHTRTEFSLFLGCDLPFMEDRFLRYLSERAIACGADATVPESVEHRLQPLAAVYRRRALGAVRASLARGENKVTRFYSRVRCQVLPWRDIARQGFARRIFDNMNMPDDYERVLCRLGVNSLPHESGK